MSWVQVVLGELALLVVFWLIFATRLFRRGVRTWVSRLLLATAVVGLVEAGALLALPVGVLPDWAYAVVFGALDVIAFGWLWVQNRALREEKQT
jgi:hypothetical protein